MDNNNNNFLYNNSDDIGIDPTTVPIVDTLDMDGPNPEDDPVAHKKKRAKELLKKTLFSVGVLALMGGVAFGLYFYLNLGSKKNAEFEAKFELEDRTIYAGQELSTSIFDYGDFANVDVSGCDLSLSGVDNTVPGEYQYSMTCHGTKYSAVITVLATNEFDITTNIVYRNVIDDASPSDFVMVPDGYKLRMVTPDFESYFSPSAIDGSPYVIKISVENEEGNKTEVVSLLYVLESEPANSLICRSEPKEEEGYTYTIANSFIFDSFLYNLNVPVRYYEMAYPDEAAYAEALSLIDQEGRVALGDFSGYALRDDANLTIRIATVLNNAILEAEMGEDFPESRSEINEYYSDLNYTCEE